MSGIDRKQILRIDCNTCKGRGYVIASDGEQVCSTCQASGSLEKEVPYKFESNGRWNKEELAEVFEVPVEQVVDAGHSAGE